MSVLKHKECTLNNVIKRKHEFAFIKSIMVKITETESEAIWGWDAVDMAIQSK